jgi:DNA processing protein
LVQEWNDVIAELPAADRRRLIIEGQQQLGLEPAPAQEQNAEKSEDPQAPVKKALLGILTVETPVHLDALLETLEYHSSSEVIAALFELEMLGLVRQTPGKNFVKVW